MVHRMARFNEATTGMMMRTGGGMTGVGAGIGNRTGRSLITTAGGEMTPVVEISAGLPLGSTGNEGL